MIMETLASMQEVLDNQNVPQEGRFLYLPDTCIRMSIRKRLKSRLWKKEFKRLFCSNPNNICMNKPNKKEYYR